MLPTLEKCVRYVDTAIMSPGIVVGCSMKFAIAILILLMIVLTVCHGIMGLNCVLCKLKATVSFI